MSKRYMDAGLTAPERAQELLKELSLEEKMAQVNSIFPFGETYLDYDKIAEDTPYGIGHVSTLEMRRVETLEEVAAWQRRVQEIVMANSPHGIPAMFHMEGLCGAFIQDSTSFPSGIARGSGWDPELEEQIAKVVGEQESACGFTHVLAPVLDISRDSRMGRQGETYGEDPALASALGAAYVKGLQSVECDGRHPESVAKHFLAFHNSQGGIHGTHSDTPQRLLEEVYGKPFQAAITQSGLKGIMPCYCSIDGEPASVSKRLLTGLLREKMGFEGICVSDYGGIGNSHEVQHIGETMADTGLLAMEAGMDMELPSASGYGEELRNMFASGEADREILDRAVLRVLEAKFRMGLFEHPFALQGGRLREVFDREEGRKLSLQSARESIVLLKNNGALPLGYENCGGAAEGERSEANTDEQGETRKDRGKLRRIALIGPHADSPRKFFGGYTHMCMMESVYAVANSIAGVNGTVWNAGEDAARIPGTNIQSDETETFEQILRRQKPGCASLLEELRNRMPETEILYAYGYPIAGDDESGFEEALQAVKEADLVILTLGGKHGTCSMASMGEGVDASDINLPRCQDAFMKKASAYGKPMIGIHFDGRPVSSDVADEVLDAILEAWNPAETGAQAIVDVLLGEYNPSGKLPVSVAYHAGQIPVYYNHPYGSAWHQGASIGFVNYVDLPHKPRYCFGHGLSYTTFLYENLQIENEEIRADERVVIRVEIMNTGKYAGTEIVQLYLSDRYASMTRPVKELAGFVRVALEPGERKQVTLEVAADQMAFLDKDMRWKVEKGVFDVEVGSSSEDIRLRAEYRVRDDGWIQGKERAFYAEAEYS